MATKKSLSERMLEIIEEANAAETEKRAAATPAPQNSLDTEPAGGTLCLADELRRAKTASDTRLQDNDIIYALNTYLSASE